MNSFSHLCPQCQRPFTSNDMYCSWCNKGFLPSPPQSNGDFSNQERTKTSQMRGFPGAEMMSPQPYGSFSPPPPPPQYSGDLSGQDRATQPGQMRGFPGAEMMSPQPYGSFSPPPPPQYNGDLSDQERTKTGQMRGMAETSPPQPSRPVKKKFRGFLLIGSILGVCVLLTAAFWIGGNVGTSRNPNTGATTRSSATSTQAATSIPTTQAISTSVGSTSTTQAILTPVVSTSLSAASLSSPKLPLTISCVNCPYPQLTMVLNSITVNKSDQSTNWVFTISNTGSHACSNLSFTSLELTDPDGTSYTGKGQAANTFAMDANQSLQVNAVFALLPTPGTQYTLKSAIYVSGCSSSFYTSNNYATENFMFA
jgi:hypothetical protein